MEVWCELLRSATAATGHLQLRGRNVRLDRRRLPESTAEIVGSPGALTAAGMAARTGDAVTGPLLLRWVAPPDPGGLC